MVIRTKGDPAAVVASVQRELRDVNPAVAIEHVKTLDEIRGDSVASRRREIAIRSAIGAQQSNIRGLVFAEGLRLVAFGVAGGVVGALALAHVLDSLLFGVEASDPLTLVAVAAVFAVVALLACWLPSRRAVRVDPAEALRAD
ncbi:MAG: FtsX-like permease family protein [Bryobacterales bacterium]